MISREQIEGALEKLGLDSNYTTSDEQDGYVRINFDDGSHVEMSTNTVEDGNLRIFFADEEGFSDRVVEISDDGSMTDTQYHDFYENAIDYIYEYDADGNPVKETEHSYDESGDYEWASVKEYYYENGELTKTIEENFNENGNYEWTVENEYENGLEVKSNVYRGDWLVETIKYDSNGNLMEKETYDAKGELRLKVEHVNNGNMTSETTKDYHDGKVTITIKELDSEGNVTKETVREEAYDNTKTSVSNDTGKEESNIDNSNDTGKEESNIDNDIQDSQNDDTDDFYSWRDGVD